jgi:rhamnosyltransferase subunit B
MISRGTAGDIVPFLEIGATLVRRNNDVLLITHCHYERAAYRVGLRFAALDTPEQFDAFVKDGPLLETPKGILEFAKKHVLPFTALEISRLQHCCRDGGMVVIARHMSSIAAPLVCEQYGLPLVSVFVVAAQARCFDVWTEFCRSVLAQGINRFRVELALPEIRDWGAWVRMPALFLACWPDWFSARTPVWPGHTSNVGFLCNDATESGDPPPEAERLMSGKLPPVLVSAGTSVSSASKHFYNIAAAACRIAGRPAILVCRHDELVSHPLPLGVVRFRELPFASVAPRVAAVIHHGGAGTMVRAAAARVPQLILPLGADRPENAACMDRAGLGAQLPPPDWSPFRVAQELLRIVDSASIRQRLCAMRERLFSPVDLENACKQIEGLVQA